MNRDLGNLGETSFVSLCHSVGIIPNPSQIDKRGWDFIIELPQIGNNNDLLSNSPLSPECKVQIKSTDKKGKKLFIKLSNMYNLIKSILPAFICLFEFNKRNMPEKFYLIHIGKDLIEKTLKRIHELDIANDTKLNKHKIQIKYTENDRIKPIAGQKMLNKLYSFFCDGFEKYIEMKKKYRNSIGYESGSQYMKFTIPDINSLSDFSVGLKNSLQIENLSIYKQRFNLISPKSKKQIDKAILTLKEIHPNDSITIGLKFENYGETYYFNVDIYSPVQFAQMLPDKYIKIRLVNDLFEIFIFPKISRMNIKFTCLHIYDFYKLNELKKILEFLSKANDKKKFIIEFIKNNNEPAELECHPEENMPNVSELYDSISSIWNVASAQGIEQIAFINLRWVENERRLIEIIKKILIKDISEIEVKFSLNSEYSFDKDQIYAILTHFIIPFKNHIIVCIFAVGGKARKKRNNFHLISKEIVYLKWLKVNRSKESSKITLKDYIQEFKRICNQNNYYRL